MEDCVALARTLGERVGRELRSPSTSTSAPPRAPTARTWPTSGAASSRGCASDPHRPQTRARLRPREMHPDRGRRCRRRPPVSRGVQRLPRAVSNLAIAKEVAKAVRGSSGGLRYVKALGLEVDGQAQVSMNLVDTDRTPLYRAYEAVRTEAEAHGVTPTWSEIVGLVPERALLDAGIRHVQLRGFTHEQLLEQQDPRSGSRRSPTLAVVPRPSRRATPTPGGGSVVAHRRRARRSTRADGRRPHGRPPEVRRGRRGRCEPSSREASTPRRHALRARRPRRRLVRRRRRRLQAAQGARCRGRGPTRGHRGRASGRRTVPLETARACAASRRARRRGRQARATPTPSPMPASQRCSRKPRARGAAYNVRINVAALERSQRAAAPLAAEAERAGA